MHRLALGNRKRNRRARTLAVLPRIAKFIPATLELGKHSCFNALDIHGNALHVASMSLALRSSSSPNASATAVTSFKVGLPAPRSRLHSACSETPQSKANSLWLTPSALRRFETNNPMSRIFIMMKFIMFRGNSQAAALKILHFNEDIRGSALGATAPRYKIPARQIRRGSAFSTRSTCSTRL